MNPCSNRDLVMYFLRLGATGFGGPIVLAVRMEQDFVEKHRWVSQQDYAEGLAFSQLSPGPLAGQLAMYLGWVVAGRTGAALSALALIAPSFLMAIGVGAAYSRYNQLGWIQALFYGVGAAVVAIITLSAYRLSRKMIGSDVFLWILFAIVGVTTAVTHSEVMWLFIVSGLLSMLWQSRARLAGMTILPSAAGWLLTGLHGPAPASVLTNLALFFLNAGALVFGSGLAIVPFLYGGVVVRYHWLTGPQFLDAIAVAMITPGPVVITSAFIGYLVAGGAGAVVAAAAVFAPPFLIVIIAAPYYRRIAANRMVAAFVQGVTAAAAGAIAGAGFILARQTLVDVPRIVISVVAFAALLILDKVPEPVWILAAGLAGLLFRPGA